MYTALPHLSRKDLASLFVLPHFYSLFPPHLPLSVLWLPSGDLWQGGRNQQLHSLPCSNYAVGKKAVDLHTGGSAVDARSVKEGVSVSTGRSAVNARSAEGHLASVIMGKTSQKVFEN